MGKVDIFLKKWLSKKLMVVVLATIMVYLGKLESQHYTWIIIGYILTQGTIDSIIHHYIGKR